VNTALLLSLCVAYIATITIASFRSETIIWNWLNLAAAAIALVGSVSAGDWITAAIWVLNCLLAIWNLRMRLKSLRRVGRPSVWTEDRL
jgi:hypothetical protein